MKIPLDKQAHFATGLAISATLVAYGISPVIAFLVGCSLGAIKELVAPYRRGHRDLVDLVATAAGATGVLPLALLTWI